MNPQLVEYYWDVWVKEPIDENLDIPLTKTPAQGLKNRLCS